MSGPRLSTLAIVGGMIVFGLFGLAAVLLVQTGPESTQRLGLFFGLAGTAVAALVAALRSDQSQKQTNGSLEDRIKAGVQAVLDERAKASPRERSTD